jgi:hypothetical protein
MVTGSSMQAVSGFEPAVQRRLTTTTELRVDSQDSLFRSASGGTGRGFPTEEAETDFFPFVLESGGDLSADYGAVHKPEEQCVEVSGRSLDRRDGSLLMKGSPFGNNTMQQEGRPGRGVLAELEQHDSWNYLDFIPLTLASLCKFATCMAY